MAENPKRQGHFLTISLVIACVVLPLIIITFQFYGLLTGPDFIVLATSLLIAVPLTIALFYFVRRHYSGEVSADIEKLEQQLRDQIKKNEKSINRYIEFTELVSDWRWEMDESFRFTYASDRFYEITGLSHSDFTNRQQDQIAKQDPDNHEWRNHLTDLITHKSFRDFTYHEDLPDGRRLWLRLSGNPKFNEQGEFDGYWGTGTNITAEVQAREEAVEATHRFLDAIESVSDGISFWDQDHKFILANKIFRSHSNQAAELLVRGTPYQVYLQKMIEGIMDGKSEAEKNEFFNHVYDMFCNPPGAYENFRNGRWYLVRYNKSPDGKTVTLTTDITDLKKHEQELQDFMDAIPLWLCYVDHDQCYQQSNLTLTEWFGIDQSEIKGKTIESLMDADSYSQFKPYIRAALEGQAQTCISKKSFFNETASGGASPPQYTETTFTPDFDESHNVIGFFIASKNATESIQIEEQLRQSQKMEAVGQLTGGIAHDFNNLLAVILGSLTMLEDHVETDRNKRLLASSLRATRRGADLTQRLLAFGRRQALMATPTDINALVEGMTELLRRTIGVDITIETILPENLWTMDVDRGQLENSLLNLALNARDALPNGGKLYIETANAILDKQYTDQYEGINPGAYVVVSVSDTGYGMSPEILDRVIEPFFTTKGVEHGTGLGLSMIYGFAIQSGGLMRIYSEEGHGTKVNLYLPVADTAEHTIKEIVHERKTIEGMGEKILVIEDEPDVRETTVIMLQQLGYQTIIAEDGVQGLELFEQHQDIDLLFTDVFLPGGLLGTDVAKNISIRNPSIPILFTSGYTANQMSDKDLISQDMQLISKPFGIQKLSVKLRELLD